MGPAPHTPPEPSGDRPTRRSIWLVIGAVALVAGLAVGLVLALPTLDPAELMARVPQTPRMIALLLVGLMVLHNFVPVPAEAIAICAGAALGIPAGVATVWIGAMLGAAIAFGLSRRLGRGLPRDPSSVLGRVDQTWQAWGAPGLIGLRLVPLISFNLINYAAGLTSVGWWTFLWTTAIGILPVLVVSVAAGAGLHAWIMGPAFYVLLGAVCVALLLARVVLRRRSLAAAPHVAQTETSVSRSPFP
ncbi:TVP38/TMEM64 family protein [Tropicimonas isoalkanivorans]|uniref:TVP38/TMEM64 family membrane protein n=1 Tax=Tropicimonas isoalkanivorans TaxID=441112 RepID=A0A1I1E4S9_9RHOB|nr:VTT domain-containing protein [Tropicimonas isoalkanivorans]SFB79873.1 Uncharacterized membrane protein YdjX, TVP38/TMEM64 family, SNARE-associated domain [Tropicimonas isoalkanivorans]